MELGITANDAAVYLHLLKGGRVSPTELAKETGIQRPRVYDSLKRLAVRGFTVEDRTGKVPKYLCADPQVMLAELERRIARKQEALEVIHEALADAFAFQLNRGVFFYETPEAAAHQIRELLTKARKQITIVAVIPAALPAQALFPWKVLTHKSATGVGVTLILNVQEANWEICARLATQKVQIYHYPRVREIRTVFHRMDGEVLCVSPVARYRGGEVEIYHSLHFYKERGMIQSVDLILQEYRAQAVPLAERLKELRAGMPFEAAYSLGTSE
jgi:predicted DNA-binding transcriptional regulator